MGCNYLNSMKLVLEPHTQTLLILTVIFTRIDLAKICNEVQAQVQIPSATTSRYIFPKGFSHIYENVGTGLTEHGSVCEHHTAVHLQNEQ